jgi:hypothetical protein
MDDTALTELARKIAEAGEERLAAIREYEAAQLSFNTRLARYREADEKFMALIREFNTSL